MDNENKAMVARTADNGGASEMALSQQSGLRADEPINLTHLTMNQLNFIGKAMAASGAFKDIQTQSAALVRILAGQEMGLGPFAAMSNINIIEGNASVGGHIMAARVKASGKYDYKIVKWDKDGCSIDLYEDGKKIGNSEFMVEDAKAAELVDPTCDFPKHNIREIKFYNKWKKQSETKQGCNCKDNWKKYPRNMFFNRAISNGVRTYCPDVLGNAPVYDPDELGASTDELGRVTELPANAVPAIAAPVSNEEMDKYKEDFNKGEGYVDPNLPTKTHQNSKSEPETPPQNEDSGAVDEPEDEEPPVENPDEVADVDVDADQTILLDQMEKTFPGVKEANQPKALAKPSNVKPTSSQIMKVNSLYAKNGLKTDQQKQDANMEIIGKNHAITADDYDQLINALKV